MKQLYTNKSFLKKKSRIMFLNTQLSVMLIIKRKFKKWYLYYYFNLTKDVRVCVCIHVYA